MTPKQSRDSAEHMKDMDHNDRLDYLVSLGVISLEQADASKDVAIHDVPTLDTLRRDEARQLDLRRALGI